MMRLKYLAHSSFEVTCGNTRIVCDPWLRGTAYQQQWYLWPLAAEKPEDIDADIILISHGHEDHLHSASLKAMKKNAHIFFPFQWRDGIKPYLRRLGFNKITEAVSFRTYMVNDVRITYIGFSLESVVVIEHDDEVLVNINDALNSNHENAVAFILREIRHRWPSIDYLLSGWSGASYFPNQIRYPGKNDIEIGQLREQYFANNFCKFTHELKPGIAIPFAPGFVLLQSINRWINHVKFPRSEVSAYYDTHYRDGEHVTLLTPYPGDVIANRKLIQNSELHRVEEAQQPYLAYAHYEKEMEIADRETMVDENTLRELLNLLRHWVNENRSLYHATVISDVCFSIRVTDSEDECYFNIQFLSGRLDVQLSSTPLEHKKLIITTTAKKLIHSLSKVWGGDVLTIGYGLLVEINDELSLEKNLDIVCVRLITRYPIARKDLLKYPMRALKFYARNPRLTSLWIRQKMELKPYVNKYPYNERDHWITYNKCDLCAVCKMPQIDLAPYSSFQR